MPFFFAGTIAHAAIPPPPAWTLPPLDGELTGEVTAGIFEGAPALAWKIKVRTGEPGQRTVEFEVAGAGAQVRGDARLDAFGEGTWRVTAAEIDLGAWGAWMAPQLGSGFSGVSVGGNLQFSGEGTWRGGVVGGRANFSWREGRIDDSSHALLLEGISVDVEIIDLAVRRTAPEQVFTWRSGRYDTIALGVGRVELAVDGDRVRVNQAAIDIFGGELSVGSLTLSLSRPEFAVTARMSGVAVDQILFLLPPVLSEAHGRLDGNVQLRRDATGMQIGDGRLALRPGETADLRLAVKPGWLSTSLPPEIVKYFPGFKKIESGEIPIRARVLEITFTPLGDAAGRTAWVHLAGGPSDPELTAPIDTTVNVRGPLEQLVKIGADLGTNSRLRFSGAR